MGTAKNHSIILQIEQEIQDSFSSFLPEETKIKISWVISADYKSIYVDYHNNRNQEIGHNRFSVNQTIITQVIQILKRVIEQDRNWIIKKRCWLARRLSIYGLILISRQSLPQTTKKRSLLKVWRDRALEAVLRKR